MALFEPNEKLYLLELSKYGLTYCDDIKNRDRLIIAPGLQGHLQDVDSVTQRDSFVDMLDYLFVGDDLVGVTYPCPAALFHYYYNDCIPDELSPTQALDIFMYALHDPQNGECEDETLLKAAEETCKTAYKFAAQIPFIPQELVDRMRTCVFQNFGAKHVIH